MTAVGTLGICTEITICLFNEYKHKAEVLMGTEGTDYEEVVDKLVDFYYELSFERQDLLEFIYRIGTNIVIPLMSEEVYRDSEGQLPLQIMMATIAGLSEEELNAVAEFLKYTSEINTANWPPNIQG